MDGCIQQPEEMIMKQVRRLTTRWMMEKIRMLISTRASPRVIWLFMIPSSSKFLFSLISPQFPLQCDNFQPLHWSRRSEPGSVALAVRESWMRCENKKADDRTCWLVRIPYISFPANLGFAGWLSYDKVTARENRLDWSCRLYRLAEIGRIDINRWPVTSQHIYHGNQCKDLVNFNGIGVKTQSTLYSVDTPNPPLICMCLLCNSSVANTWARSCKPRCMEDSLLHPHSIQHSQCSLIFPNLITNSVAVHEVLHTEYSVDA